jgi:PPOX class probable F420-dependent enzyme
VSIAFDDDRAFFRSYNKAWKTKRLRNNPTVEVAPATFRGKVTGPTIQAHATRLSDGDANIAAKALVDTVFCKGSWCL